MVRTDLQGKTLICLLAILCASNSAEADFLSPRQARRSPRGRIACLPSPTMGTRYMDSDDLGRHSYGFTLWEGNGIVYTCRGGHVDVTHLRKVADWTAYLAYHLRETMLKNETQMSYKMWEPSRYHIEIDYPPGWEYLPAESRSAIAREAAIDLAAYLGYTASVWHEILTWHGFKGAGVYPEYHSAFSWEDNYSNAMGSYIAALALRDRQREYEEAVTLYLDQKIRSLGGQSRQVARQAGEAVRGLWFTGGFVIVTMVKRHLDIGFDTGSITPWVVPGMADCRDGEPWLCPVPNLNALDKHGLRVTVEIEPKEWEKGAILRKAYPDRETRRERIDPTQHIAVIMEGIRAETIERYGATADAYEVPDLALRTRALATSADPTASTMEPNDDTGGEGTESAYGR